MAKIIRKASMVISGFGLSTLLQPQVHADEQFDNETIIQDVGTFLGTPVKLRGSEPVNLKPISSGSDFEWVQNNGTDLKKVNVNGAGRAPNVKLTMHTEQGHTLVGSGAFVGNSTILSVAHNFLGISPGTKITRVTVTVGSNSDVDTNWNTTSGYSFDVNMDDIHFFDKSTYLKNRDAKTETSPYDLAAIHTPIPYQLIVNKLKDQGVNLGTYNTLQLADDSEIARINNRDNVLSGEHVRMYGYPGANASDQVYFNPKLQQGYLYEVDTTVTNTETYVGDGSLSPVRFTKLRNTTMGGMSGSNLTNTSGQVIGVHQSATNRNKETDTPQNEKTWRATQMLLNPQHYQWLKSHINDDSQKGFVTFEGNRYYYDDDGSFLRNTTKEITEGGATKVYQFDDRGIATEKVEVNEKPVDKVDVPTEKPVDKVDVPTEKPVDKVDVPTEKTVSETSQEKIPYHTQIVKDATIPKGERRVVQNGKDGIKNVVRTWSLTNGQKSGDPKVDEIIQSNVVDEIVHVGIREDLVEMNFEKMPSGGQRAVIDFQSIAEGKDVGTSRRHIHLLRPSNKITIKQQFGVHKSHMNADTTESLIRKLYASFKSLSIRRFR